MSEEVAQINDVCRISRGTSVKVVKWISNADLRIDGSFEGNINTKGRIVVGEKGYLTGIVVCGNLDVWGEFSGTVLADGLTTIRGNGRFSGVTNTRRICIEVGALFEGTCKVISADEFGPMRETVSSIIDNEQ